MDIKNNTNNAVLPGDAVMVVENAGVDLNVVDNKPNNTILEGICAVFNKPNNNKRVYSKEEYLPHLSYLQEKVKARQLVGDLDHPPHFDVKLKTASHIIEDLSYNGGDTVNIKVRILENTPNGKIAKALIDSGVNLSVSSRAAGKVASDGTVKIFRIFTYDLVAEPGFTEAVLKQAMNESLEHNFQMITESLDALKRESYVEKNGLMDISESLNYDERFKIYKLKDNIPLNENINDDNVIITNQKNEIKMSEYITRDQMNEYSKVVKNTIDGLKKEIAGLNESLKNAKASAVNESEDVTGLPEYVNYLAETVENLISHNNYLTDKLNKTIRYAETLAEGINSLAIEKEVINENVTNVIEYAEHLGDILNESINESSEIRTAMNGVINYQNYIAKELDKSIQFAEYVAECANNGILYSEELAEEIQNNREYSEFIAENLNNNINYANYIAESLNNNVLNNLDNKSNLEDADAISENVSNLIKELKDSSSTSVLESRYPFLKVLSKENKDKFYQLDNDMKTAIVEAVNGAVWFNENDVVSIMESVIEHKTKDIPTYIKFMPNEYKELWEKMNESEKNMVHVKSQLYTINTPYQAKAFWDGLDLRGINERIEIEKNNRKVEKINESQSTEGISPQNGYITNVRGYSQEYLEALKRNASYRK